MPRGDGRMILTTTEGEDREATSLRPAILSSHCVTIDPFSPFFSLFQDTVRPSGCLQEDDTAGATVLGCETEIFRCDHFLQSREIL